SSPVTPRMASRAAAKKSLLSRETVKHAASRVQSIACDADEWIGHRSSLVRDGPACLPIALRHCVSVSVSVNERATCMLGRVCFELILGPLSRDTGLTPSQWN